MNRSEILQAAAQVIRVKGFHAASMQDIANAVDLRKASLYHHISSKQEILLRLLDLAMDLLIERIGEVVESDETPKERIRQAIATYLEILTQEGDLAAVLLLEYRSLKPELRKKHQPRRDLFESLWRDLIREGIDEGQFAPYDPSLVAKSLLGTMNWTITWYRQKGDLGGREIGHYFADIFLEGLLRRE